MKFYIKIKLKNNDFNFYKKSELLKVNIDTLLNNNNNKCLQK